VGVCMCVRAGVKACVCDGRVLCVRVRVRMRVSLMTVWCVCV
jgi:hypothetical protein